MTTTTILNLTLVAPNQNQKETTINSNFAIIEASVNDILSISLAAGNRTLTTDEFTKRFHFIFSGQTAARQVTVPNTKRFFSVSNEGTYDITVKALGSSGATTLVPAGKRVLILSDGTDVDAISSGVSQLEDLSDTVGLDSVSAGQILAYQSGAWTPIYNVSEESLFVPGVTADNQKVYGKVYTKTVLFFSDFSESQARAGVAATGSTVYRVYKNATQVGTITFAAAGTTGTFSTDMGGGSTTVTFNPGDYLTIQGPADNDATLADLYITLKGVNL